jgi:8-amino-7-oxononanoate synthase
VPDFTSALYLGLGHPSGSLAPWDRLTTGRPAALSEPPAAGLVAGALAKLQRCAAATVATSTLHLFWDLFGILGGDGRVAIHLDAETYPVARWGAERAACRGVPVRTFAHHDPAALERAVVDGTRPLVVTDGFCPGCGRSAPLRAYAEVAGRLGGHVIVDDTQALGVLGAGAGPGAPYGRGGGGSPRWQDVEGPELVIAASLAKGFGAPLAALSGPGPLVARFEAESATRVHSSPPSAAALRAAQRALALNDRCGDALRLRLARLVRHFRARLRALGFDPLGGLFPIQTIAAGPAVDPAALHGFLLERHVRAVLAAGPRLSFLITARHTFAEIDRAADVLGAATARRARRLGGCR